LIQHTNIAKERDPIRKVHYVGTSVVLTIDPSHVKRLDIDELTFFVQKPIENGILLEKRKLTIGEEIHGYHTE
jgi:hypothetical protein